MNTIIQIENRLRSRLATQAINDPDFQTLLSNGAANIRVEAERASNEATVEAAFERHMFTILRSIGIDYAPVKEGRVLGTILRQSGRTDSRFRDVIIEFKHRSEMSTSRQVDQHIEQLKDYLQALGSSEGGEQIGFLTDGLHFVQCVRDQQGLFAISAIAQIDGRGLSVICRALVAAKSSALRADNLVRDFCGDVQTGHVFIAARELLACLIEHSTLKSEMLRAEWESLFRLAHEDTSQQKRIELRRKSLEEIFGRKITHPSFEYLCLFSLHTAYSIIVKLVSYKVVSDTMFGRSLQDYKSLLSADDRSIQAFCSTLEDGELFRQIGILNLLEGDFYSWYSDKHQWNEGISRCIKDILGILSRYEDARNIFRGDKAVDLFRQLYEASIPQVVRSSFGEFYTPLWLAQNVLRSSGFRAGERVLDPCCGSGTFLIAALQDIRQNMQDREPDFILSTMLESVVGIDLNPLAVLTARVHYFIYISDLLDKKEGSVVIPIYLGDASNVPTVIGSGAEAYISYKINTLKTQLEVTLPISFITNAESLFTIMNEFESLLSQGDYAAAKQTFEDYCDEHDLPEVDRGRLAFLAEQITELERKEWNGIWARIVANFASTVAIGKFDRVIGNPPWIDWKSLPAGYRETVKQLCLDRGLFSGAGRTGGINLNVCALITHVAATNWLAPSGTLAFLMPRELAVQPSYEGWRRSVGGPNCQIVEFHDWSNAGHPFEPVREDFMTYILSRREDQVLSVSCKAYSKLERNAKPWLWESLQEADANLIETARAAEAIIPGKSAFTFADTPREIEEFASIAGQSDYIGREGIEFYPQELVMFRYLRPGTQKGTVFVENFQGRKSKFKIPKQTILLETEFLYPLVKGPYILPFEYEENDLLVAFPYRESDPHRPITRAELRKTSPLLLNYFLKFEEQFSAQTAYSDSIRAEGEFYGLARTGPYSFAQTYVAFRDNTKWAACVITDKEMPWGERKRYLFQNHAVSMCEDSERNFITQDEAHYVAAILNADVTARFIIASSDERSFKIRPPIHIPRYDSSDEDHRNLATISKRAHLNPDRAKESSEEASNIYLSVCRKSKT